MKKEIWKRGKELITIAVCNVLSDHMPDMRYWVELELCFQLHTYFIIILFLFKSTNFWYLHIHIFFVLVMPLKSKIDKT